MQRHLHRLMMNSRNYYNIPRLDNSVQAHHTLLLLALHHYHTLDLSSQRDMKGNLHMLMTVLAYNYRWNRCIGSLGLYLQCIIHHRHHLQYRYLRHSYCYMNRYCLRFNHHIALLYLVFRLHRSQLDNQMYNHLHQYYFHHHISRQHLECRLHRMIVVAQLHSCCYSYQHHLYFHHHTALTDLLFHLHINQSRYMRNYINLMVLFIDLSH
jgi:hypothetical protein